MAVIGKKRYYVYLTPENVEVVKAYLDSRKYQGGLSACVDRLISVMADTLRESGVDERPMNWAKVTRMWINGIKALNKMP